MQTKPFFLSETMASRPRRNRKSPVIRSFVRETQLTADRLMAPLFLYPGTNTQNDISSMPGVHRYSIDCALKKVEQWMRRGIRAVDLFSFVPKELKSPLGEEALREDNLVFTAVRALKNEFPELCVMVDIALDPYTDHGHDGVLNEWGEVDNDETVKILGDMSLRAAEAGADLVGPSDMMDGRVGYIRKIFDENGYSSVGIMSYTAKYASALYGPFRDALQSAPRFGDKRQYQMDPANLREALREAALDEQEGADYLMVKPGLAYLDVIAALRRESHLPIVAYHVSGEYSMVMAAGQNGWLDADRVFLEHLLCMRRAGADVILTYAAERVANLLS